MEKYKNIIINFLYQLKRDSLIDLDDFLKQSGIKDKNIIKIIKEKLFQIQLKQIKSSFPDIEYKYRFESNNSNLFIIITSKCDHTCIFCDRSSDILKNNGNKYASTLNDIKKILLLNKYNSFSKITIGGDEPLSNPNISEIIGYLDSLGKKIHIFTSLSRDISFIKDYKNIKKIIYPIYGSNENIHDKITGVKGSFNFLSKQELWLKTNKYSTLITKLAIRKNYKDKAYFKQINTLNFLLPNSNDSIRLYTKNAINFIEIKEVLKTIINYGQSIGNICVNNNNLPICLLKDFPKKHIDSAYKILKEKEKGLMNTIKKTVTNKDVFTFVKKDECKACKYFDICKGYYRIHFDIFPHEQVYPIK